MSKYNQYSRDNNVNIIPEEDFKRLIHDTFHVITTAVGETAGPYGSQVMTTFQNQSATTKDGYNALCSISFTDPYQKMVYLNIKEICERVNNTVGDGTTSCLLLAENLFNAFNDIIKTPEQKRQLLTIFNDIETQLMNPDNKSDYKLNKETLFNLINLAGNYDKKLTEKVIEALDPKYDDNDVVVSLRNVIPEKTNNFDSNETEISIMKLPGDYHIRIRMEISDIEEYLEVRDNVRVVLYDHAMTESEWLNLEKPANPEDSLIIIARDFTKGCLEKCVAKYIRERMIHGIRNNVHICWILGNTKTELKDLSMVLDTPVHSLVYNDEIKYEDLPIVKMEIFNNNCMGFHIENKKTTKLDNYIDTIIDEMNADMSNSIIAHSKYQDRIDALRMESVDTIITCCGTSPLELSMLMDKIDDCISIVKSAYKWGTVPNLLKYGYSLVKNTTDHRDEKNMRDNSDELYEQVIETIMSAIKQYYLFIIRTKYGTEEEMINQLTELYVEYIVQDYYTDDMEMSYDLITGTKIKAAKLPTSAQYDIEVIVAAISIVKYLLTSRLFIFDPTTPMV